MKKTKAKVVECFECNGLGVIYASATSGADWSHQCFTCHGTGFVKLSIKDKVAQIDSIS